MDNYVRTFEQYKAKELIINFLKKLRDDLKGKYNLRKTFIKYLNGQEISKEEADEVRNELLDLLKMVGLGGIFILPGSMLVIPFIIKLCNKYNINVVPHSFQFESASSDEILNLIEDGKKIYVKYIQDYPEHKKEDSYRPVDIDNDGNITLDIDNELYYTKVEWVEGIDEMNFVEIAPDNTDAASTEAEKDRATEWKRDTDFVELLKDHGGMKKVIAKMKDNYDLDYSNCESEEELHKSLRADNMI